MGWLFLHLPVGVRHLMCLRCLSDPSVLYLWITRGVGVFLAATFRVWCTSRMLICRQGGEVSMRRASLGGRAGVTHGSQWYPVAAPTLRGRFCICFCFRLLYAVGLFVLRAASGFTGGFCLPHARGSRRDLASGGDKGDFVALPPVALVE